MRSATPWTALDALSVSVEDADAGSDQENALFGEPGMPPPAQAWEQSRVTALFNDVASAEAARCAVQQLPGTDCQPHWRYKPSPSRIGCG